MIFCCDSWWSSGKICSIRKKRKRPINVHNPIYVDDACGCANASGNKCKNTLANWLPSATLNINLIVSMKMKIFIFLDKKKKNMSNNVEDIENDLGKSRVSIALLKRNLE